MRPELHLGGEIFIPHVAGWRRDRSQAYPADDLSVVPDWICEVMSLDGFNRVRFPLYARYGVRHGWIVDAELRMIETFWLRGEHWFLGVIHVGDDLARIEPFDAIEFPLATLWLPDNPPA